MLFFQLEPIDIILLSSLFIFTGILLMQYNLIILSIISISIGFIIIKPLIKNE